MLENIFFGEKEIGVEEDYVFLGIELRILVIYGELDNFFKISFLIMSLDFEDNNIVFFFEYWILFGKLNELKNNYIEEVERFGNRFGFFLKENLGKYFGLIVKKSLLYSDDK